MPIIIFLISIIYKMTYVKTMNSFICIHLCCIIHEWYSDLNNNKKQVTLMQIIMYLIYDITQEHKISVLSFVVLLI